MAFTPILFEYGSSPFSQKVHLFCTAAGIDIKSCDQPPILPRPTLENLGITYRRIPILAIGKDFFADSSLILDVLQENFTSKLATSPADKTYELFANSLFRLALKLADGRDLPEAFVKDRETIFPELCDPDADRQRPSVTAEIRASFDIVERQFLGGGKQFINGNHISLSDVHIAWIANWILRGAFNLSKKPGFGEKDFPNIFAWLDRLPKAKGSETISDDDAVKAITAGSYFVKATSNVEADPLGLAIGDEVAAETSDSTPGSHPQYGKLVSLTIDTVVLQLKNELRVHFPRRGTIVTKA